MLFRWCIYITLVVFSGFFPLFYKAQILRGIQFPAAVGDPHVFDIEIIIFML